jgi:alpha-L-fucosidase 2
LPALPDAWEEGNISGICARGGFELGINWKEGKLTEVTISSNNGGRCNLRYAGSTLSFNTKKGGTYKVVLKNGKLKKA